MSNSISITLTVAIYFGSVRGKALAAVEIGLQLVFR